MAKRTRQVTTQREIRYLQGNLDRRFKTRLTKTRRQLLYTKVYANTIFSSPKSVRGNTCAEIFMTSEGLVNGMVVEIKSGAYLAWKSSARRTEYQTCW